MSSSGSAGRVVVAGSLNLDLGLAVPRLPRSGETVSASGRQDGPGGKGLNQAVAAARAGASTAFVGCVGDDDAGRVLLGALTAAGIDVEDVRTLPDTASGVAVVAVDDGGANCIVVVAGANGRVEAEQVEAVALGADDVLVAQGEIPAAATLAFLQAGRRVGARTVLNLAPFHPPSVELLQATSILVVNETELLDLVEAFGRVPDGTDPGPDGLAVVVAAERLLSLGVDAVLLTLGAAGMVAVRSEGLVAEPAHRVTVVDTTGAGDAVVGVLAAELVRGAELDVAMRTASAAAALVVGRRGASTAMPTRAETEAVLRASADSPRSGA